MTNTDLLPALERGLRELMQFRGLTESSGLSSTVAASLSEAIALRVLQDGSTSQQQLGESLGLEKSTISRLVESLVAKGWVTKSRDPGNGRIRIVGLSDAGREVAAELARAMALRHRRILERLTPVEAEALAVALPALMRSLSEAAAAEAS
ncbi:MAG: MarR family transcriptional regulator [Rhodoglobus sp.]|nr:MarR family transcriptional regulator [Rhodoglobus sp.]